LITEGSITDGNIAGEALKRGGSVY